MIHVLNSDDKIIDFISKKDNAIKNAVQTRNVNENSDVFDFEILTKRAEHFRKRNRLIIQDKNGDYCEYIITRVIDSETGYTQVESDASYYEDIAKSKPVPPNELKDKTNEEALLYALADTGWKPDSASDYGGVATTKWQAFNDRYKLLLMLETTYKQVLKFTVQIKADRIEGRYVALKDKNLLFSGKEIVYGKDLVGMTRTIDLTEVRTALIGIAPSEDESKPPLTVEVVDDEAQSQFGLTGRYLWDVYEPQSDDQEMSEKHLTVLTQNDLDKRKKSAISYEVTSLDISKTNPLEIPFLRDVIRIKNLDMVPHLYVEAEIIGETYDLISGESTYIFGQYKEFEESSLRASFTRLLDKIRAKLVDKISNANTIIEEKLNKQLEKYELKIIKSDTPPENPAEDTLWLDTSNPNVAVLYRFKDGKWVKASVDNINQLGGLTREQSMLHDLKTAFELLTQQDARLQREVFEILSSKYLIDEDAKLDLNAKLSALSTVFLKIKENLDSMTDDTATIGKLVDTQALFKEYREKLQDLYNVLEHAKSLVEERFKLLQSQYTDEKFNSAMQTVADRLPNGHWNADTGELTADIPNKAEMDALQADLGNILKTQLEQSYQTIMSEVDSILKVAKDEISGNVSSIEKRVEKLKIDGTNLLTNSSKEYTGRTTSLVTQHDLSPVIKANPEGTKFTLSFDIKSEDISKQSTALVYTFVGEYTFDKTYNVPVTTDWTRQKIEGFVPKKTTNQNTTSILAFYGGYNTDNVLSVKNVQLEIGEEATPYSLSPKDFISTLDEYKDNATQDFLNKLAESKSETTNDFTSKLNQLQANAEADYTKKIEDANINTRAELTGQMQSANTKIQSDLMQQITDARDQVMTNAMTNIQAVKEQTDQSVNEKVNTAKTEAQKDYTDKIAQAKTEATTEAKEYAKAQDEVTTSNVTKYTDSAVAIEKERATRDAENKLEESKQYAESKSNEALQTANANLERETAPIKATVKTQSADIKILKDGINLKANSDEVSRMINKSLQPISQLVDSNKATLDLLPDQINSKVSRNNYETDMRNVVKRLNSSDSERKQLSNQISDKVSQYEYNRMNDTLNNLQTSVTQNGRDIRSKASKEEFDSKSRTLSRVVSEVVNSAVDGLSLRFDENGAIQSFSMGYNGVKLNSNKININNGDIIIKDGVASIKQAFIDRLKATDITADRIKGGTFSGQNMYMQNTIEVLGSNNGIKGNYEYQDDSISSNPKYYKGDYALDNASLRFKGDVWNRDPTSYGGKGSYIGYGATGFGLANIKLRYYKSGYYFDNDYPSFVNTDITPDKITMKKDGQYPITIDANDSSITVQRLRNLHRIDNIDRNFEFAVRVNNVVSVLGIGVSGNTPFLSSTTAYERTGGGSTNLAISQAGNFYRVVSARKYKKDISYEKIENAMNILKVKPASWTDKNAETPKRWHGLIAEDIEALGFSNYVTYNENGEVEGLMYERLWIPLIEVVKQQQKEIENLKEAVNGSAKD